ncbi:MAG: hypothetical protein QM755_08835 [Luteolibacter sp.]
MKGLYRCLGVALLTYLVVTAALHFASNRELGTLPLAGTPFKVTIRQNRSGANAIGQGATEIYCALIDDKGIWRMTQRLHVIGKHAAQWATWDHPDTLHLREKDGLQMLDVTFRFADGETVANEVCLGVSPRP